METKRFMNRKNEQTTLRVSDKCLKYSGLTIEQMEAIAKCICDAKNVTFVTPDERKRNKKTETNRNEIWNLIVSIIKYIAVITIIMSFGTIAMAIIGLATGQGNPPMYVQVCFLCFVLFFATYFWQSEFVGLLKSIAGS